MSTFPSVPGLGAGQKEIYEYPSPASFPATGAAGRLYIDGATGAVYRWNGSGYSAVTSSGSVVQAANLASFPATGASATLYIATDTGFVYRWNGTSYVQITGSGGGVSDHGALTGLTDDDHPQYFNQARGDARYALLGHTHAFTLDDLSDVNVAGASEGQVLKRVGGQWIAAADAAGGGGATLADGDYGDITVGGLGTSMTLDDGTVTPSKLSAAFTAAGKNLVTAADAAAQRTLLGLGSAALQASSAFETAGATSTHAALSTAHGISAYGSTLVGSVDAAAARGTLGISDAFILDRANHTGTQGAATISDFSEAVDDRVATLLTAGSNVTLTYNDATNTLTISAAGAGGGATLADGNYGDVTVSGTGSVITINNASVTLAKLANVATGSILGRTTAGTGSPEALTPAQARTVLGLVIGSDVQAYSANLAAFAGLTSAADKLAYFTGAGSAAVADFTAAARTLMAATTAAAQRAALGLVIGTDVQAFDAELSAIAGLTSAANQLPYFTGSGTAALTTLSAYARTLLDDADAATARTTLGLGTIATLAAPAGTVVGTTDAQTLTNKTLTAPVIGTISNTGTLTLPTSTDTLVGRATTDTLSNKTLSAAIFTGIESHSGASAYVANAMVALAVDVTRALNTKSISADSTLTFSGTPASANTVFTLAIANTDTNPHVITIPSSYSVLRQAAITAFTMPASSQYLVTWRYDGTGYQVFGEPAPDGFLAEQSIASATTTDLGAATSNNVAITGTTTITGLGTANAGTYRQGRFTGILTFTHNGTSLILPNNGSNITTAANDRFGAYSLGSGNWLVLWYQRANGQSLVSGGGVSDGDKGDITVSSAGATWTVDNGVITYAKMQNVSATARLLGRNTAGAGVVEEVTLSQLLDFIGSAAQGDILYRGASAWARLGAGTSGQFLQTQGAGANPQWSTPAGSGDVSSNTATSVDGEIALFNATSGKSIKRAAITGMLKAASGVLSAATAGSDYYAPGGTDVALADGGTGASDAAGARTNLGLTALATTTPGTGVATFLTTPSSANLAAAVTDETGSGALVFATSPTLVTPILGTPTSGNLSNCTADGTDAVGFRGIPINSQSAAYTTVLSDAGKCIYHPSADTTARTFTIAANASVAYPVGATLMFENDIGAGTLTIAINTDTLVLVGAAGSTGSRTLAAGGRATAVKVAATRWRISGTAELT